MPLFSFDDKRVKKVIKDAVDAKEGDFNGQKMLMGTTVNPVVVINNMPLLKFVYYGVTAVQNTWYTVLEENNVELSYVSMKMSTLAEDIAMRWTIDDNIRIATQAGAVAGTDYYGSTTADNTWAFILSTSQYAPLGLYNTLKCKSCKIEIRKTSANGANTLSSAVEYLKW